MGRGCYLNKGELAVVVDIPESGSRDSRRACLLQPSVPDIPHFACPGKLHLEKLATRHGCLLNRRAGRNGYSAAEAVLLA